MLHYMYLTVCIETPYDQLIEYNILSEDTKQ